MSNLTALLQAFEANIPNLSVQNTSVSQREVGWHIDHSLKVINGVLKQIIGSDPKTYKWTFNKMRMLVFLMGKIPRGKAKAPKAVQPTGMITPEEVIAGIQQTKNLLEQAQNCDPKSNFKHPYFDVLNLKQTHRFLYIHTKHHLNIIQDIVAKKS
jgi:hypothetical protein